MMDEVSIQRDYFTNIAVGYDMNHSIIDDHWVAFAWLEGLFHLYGFESCCEVGAGTGRHLLGLQARFPNTRFIGVEPVEAMRQQGYAKGISKDVLVDGDGNHLQFPDESFDVVVEFACLHHLRYPDRVIAEMLRVAGKAIFISDSNNFGHGTLLVRQTKKGLRNLRLWSVFDFIRSYGRRYYISQGDGVAYSYSVFNNLAQINKACAGGVHILNSSRLAGRITSDLLTSASTVALLGLKSEVSKLGSRYCQ
jgi:ubiquinone/menaquinone biosynthesis C-methylase UbiE